MYAASKRSARCVHIADRRARGRRRLRPGRERAPARHRRRLNLNNITLIPLDVGAHGSVVEPRQDGSETRRAYAGRRRSSATRGAVGFPGLVGRFYRGRDRDVLARLFGILDERLGQQVMDEVAPG